METPDQLVPSAALRAGVSPVLAIGVGVAGGLLLTWPALHNGYPLVYQDSAWYLAPAINEAQHPLRTLGYSLFASVALTIQSLWSIIILQSLVTSLLLARVASLAVVRPADRLGLVATCLVATLTLSGAAKYASWLMADITSAWLFLAGVLWLMAQSRWDRAAAIGVAVISVLSHNSHLPLVLATSVVAVVLTWALGSPSVRRAAVGLAIASCLLIPVVWCANALTGERGEVLRGTSPLLLYNLSDSGVLLDVLDSGCDTKRWRMCGYRAEIAEHVDEKMGWLLFDPQSPFFKVGGYASDEVGEIVWYSVSCCMPRIITTTLEEAWQQFWEIDSLDGLLSKDTGPTLKLLRGMARPLAVPRPDRSLVEPDWFARETARREFDQLWKSRQRQSLDLAVRLLPIPETALQAIFLLLGTAIAVYAYRRGERRPTYLIGGLVVVLILNAVICSFGSSVNGRYQGRLAWLLPPMIVLGAYWAWRCRSDRGTSE